jgi:hypothetical protein
VPTGFVRSATFATVDLSDGTTPELRQAGVPLRQLLLAVGDSLDVLATPSGLDVQVRDVVIVDPEEDSGTRPGDLLLVIGVRGKAAMRLVRAAGRGGAAAVAVKVGNDRDAPALRDAAVEAGVALFGVRTEVRWERFETLARSAVDATEGEFEALGDL